MKVKFFPTYLLNWLYTIKRKFYFLLNMAFISPVKRNINISSAYFVNVALLCFTALPSSNIDNYNCHNIYRDLLI